MTSYQAREETADAAPGRKTPVSRLRQYEVQVRLRLRVLATDEEQAARIVAEEVADPIAETAQELHTTNPRLAAWRLHADDLVEEVDA